MRAFLLLLFYLLVLTASGQTKTAQLSGNVVNEDGQALQGVEINIGSSSTSIFTNENGHFNISIPAHRSVIVVFSLDGYQSVQKSILLKAYEEAVITVTLVKSQKVLENIIIKDETHRRVAGLINVNPKNTTTLPSATGGVEGLLKILVGSNNELTSQYSVRGGNYDENLIYINDFEIFRPFLTRSGQQEGLSFINPALVKNIQFYSGGFQAKYGDKISSALDIQYKLPSQFSASAYISLLEQGLHVEGVSKNKKFTWLAGARSKTNQTLLSSQDLKGNYIPSASDFQSFITWQVSPKSTLEMLGILSGSKFELIPESVQKSAVVITPFYAVNMGLDIYFEGREADKYRNSLLGLTFENRINDRLKLKWLLSRFTNKEFENFDIAGTYLFGERSMDQSSADFGEITNPFGAGVFHNYARNRLDLQILQLSHKGSLKSSNHFYQWGFGVESNVIKDKLWEWEYVDSAGYSLPYDPSQIHLQNVWISNANLDLVHVKGYLQDNILLGENVTLQAGVRFNYRSLNQELIVSPRAQISFTPNWERDIVFKAAAGIYSQPPFYREMRRPDGSINKDLKSQKSMQYIAGFDYNFPQRNRPVRLSTEIYYKSLWDVVSYDMENVRIRYSGENDAVAYAAGIETRLFTELVKDAESWFSIGIGRTEENLKNDFYYDYLNAAGEVINLATKDKQIADSIKHDIGYVRRPTDRLFTAGLFLQDYLSTDKNFKVHLSILYGSNMSFNLPGNAKYRNALIIEPYIRADLGLSAQLLGRETFRRSYSPFRNFKSIWAALEVYNLINRANVISYQLIKDYSNNIFSIPNRLTPRQVNFKLRAEF